MIGASETDEKKAPVGGLGVRDAGISPKLGRFCGTVFRKVVVLFDTFLGVSGVASGSGELRGSCVFSVVGSGVEVSVSIWSALSGGLEVGLHDRSMLESGNVCSDIAAVAC